DDADPGAGGVPAGGVRGLGGGGSVLVSSDRVLLRPDVRREDEDDVRGRGAEGVHREPDRGRGGRAGDAAAGRGDGDTGHPGAPGEGGNTRGRRVHLGGVVPVRGGVREVGADPVVRVAA